MSTNSSKQNFAKDNGLNNVAVIIGIDDYNLSKEKFKPLNNAAKDAIDLAKVLQDSYDYTVHLFTDKQSDLSFENPIKEPTHEAIDTFLTKDLPEIVNQSTLKTCLLFYFAGHGVAEKSETDPQGFLIPQDAQDNDRTTWLEMKKVYEVLSGSRCHHVLAILDSCYSGAFLWAIGGRKATVERPEFYKEHLQRYRNQPTQLLMYSAAYNQEASDGSRGDKSGNSPFAAALCSVLKNNVDTPAQTKSAGHGIITTSQLFSEIQKDLLDAYQQPGVYPLKREFVGREYIFYNPEFDASNLEPAPAINEQNNPYRGLQAFEERHVAVFRGRAKLTEKLFDRLHLPITTKLEELNSSPLQAKESVLETEETKKPALPLTIVLGNSGSGKSSLVKAGLLPTLRDKSDWRILDPIRPGAEPFMSLARAFLPIAYPNFLNEGLKDLDQYFKKLIGQKTQFAQSWEKAHPEARLLIVRDYYDEKNNSFNIEGINQSELPESMKALYTKVKSALDSLAQRLEEDSQKDEPTALAAIVQTWCQDQMPNTHSRLLLVVDQMEELLTLDRSAKAKSQTNKVEKSVSDRFLITILAALNAESDRFRVVMTLRSDFEPRFLTTPLKEWLPYSRFPVRPMSTDELRQAIEEPAQAHALEFEPPQLVGQLIDELGQPGALPLLSFVLSELYLDLAKERQADDENRALVLDERNQPGGIVGFLSRRADTEYEKLKHDFGEEGQYYQEMMQQVMLRMVTIEGGSSAKRRVPKSELDYPKQEDKYCKKVIERLVSARLLIEGRDEGEPYYEPAHDYLISGWALLQTWIEQKKDDLALQQRLIPAAKEWNERRDQSPAVQNKRSSGKVTRWSGVRREGLQLARLTAFGVGRSLFLLMDAIEYAKRKVVGLWRNQKDPDRRYEKPADYLWDDDPRINQLSFLLDSRSWLNKVESDFVRYSVVQKQQIRTVVSFVVLLGVGAIAVAGAAAINGQRKAQLEQAKTAVESANANLQTGQDLEAIKNVISGSAAIKQDVQVLGISVPNILQPIAEQNNLQEAQNHLQEALFKSVYLTKERNRLSLNRGNIYQIATTPANALINTNNNQTVKIATVEEGDSIRLLNDSGTQLFQRSACPSSKCKSVYSVAFGVVPQPKGNKDKQNIQLQLATGGDSGVIYLWNVNLDGTIEGNGNPLQSDKLQENDASIDQLSYNSAGTKLALIQDHKVWLWQSEKNSSPPMWKGTQPQSLLNFPKDETNKNEVEASSLAFNPTKEQLAIGLSDGQIAIWDVSKLQEPPKIVDAGIKIPSIAFSQDGKTLAVGGSGGAVKLFSVNGDGTIDPASPNTIDTQQPRTYNLAFLDNKQLLTVGVSDTVGRYAVNTLKSDDQHPITAQQNEQRQIKSVVYSPDGQLIATVADDDSIRLWNRQGKQLARSSERDYYVQSLAFSPNGKMLVSSGAADDDQGDPGEKGVIEAWNISSQQPDLGDPIATYPNLDKLDANHNKESLSASKNVEFVKPHEIVSVGANGNVFWLEIDKNNEFTVSDKDAGYDYLAKSRNFAFSPTGQGAIITEGGVLQLWDNSTKIGSDDTNSYTSVAFSPDGTKLATGIADGLVQIWQVPLSVDGKVISGKTLSPLGEPLQTHQQVVNTLAFSPDDPNALMTGGADGQVKFWDLSQNMPDSSKLALRDIQTIAFSPSTPIPAAQTVTSSLQPNWIFGGLPGGDLLQPIWGQVSHFFSLNAAASQPVQRLAVIDQDKQLKLWDVQPEGSAKLNETKLDSKVKAELADSRQLVLSPDSDLLVAIDAQNAIKAWNLESGQAIDWQAAASPVALIKAIDAKFSQDGKVLITLGEDKKLKLWSVANDSIRPYKPSKIQSPEAQADRSTAQPEDSIDDRKVNTLYRVATSPDNQLAILFKNEQLIKFWNLKSLDKSGEFKLPQRDSQILFSPDGKIVATVGKDNDREVIRLWNRASRNLTKTLELPPVSSDKLFPEQVKVVFSPDSHLLIATNSTGTLSLWDTEGKSIFQFPEAIKSASFTTDGKHLSVVLPNGELSSWSIDRADLLAKACEMRDKFKQNDTTSIDPQACSTDTAIAGAAFSTGEKLLIPSVTNLNKLAGINRFQQNNFAEAAQLLSDSLQEYPNDPEALIYYNNAEILENPAYTEANIHTIAVPVPIGTNPDAAQEILRGVAQAQKDINADRKNNGKPLLRVMIANDSVMTANDDENLAIARQVAQRLVDDPEVEAVVGHYASGTTKEANEIYKTGKLVSISPVSTAVDLFKPDSPYAFRTVPNDQMAAKRLAEYMVQQGKTKAVVFYNSTSTYSNSIQQAFETELKELKEKGSVVRIDLSKPFDAAQEMKTILAQYSDKDTAIALFPNSGVLPKAIEIMKENFAQPKKFLMLGGDDVYSPLVLKDAGEAAVGLVVAVPWHIDGHNDPFVTASRSLWHADVNWRSATAYDAVKALAKGLEHNPTRKGLAAVLRAADFEADGAAANPVKFQAGSGDRDQPSDLVQVQVADDKSSRSKTGFDFNAAPTVDRVQLHPK